MPIAYHLRRTGRRSRNISVRVHSDATVRVCAPNWASLKDIQGVVQKYAVWIAEQVEQARAIAPRYEDGALHFLLGKRYPLSVVQAPGRAAVVFTGRRLRVTSNDTSAERLRELLRSFYRSECATTLAPRITQLCARSPWVGAEPAWGLRRMRAQWGSCAANGALTFNTQLVKAPPHLIDYVIQHELAHIRHHDHGRGFERLMDAQMPDWRVRRRDLNTLGSMILVD
jgi:predicted metal-dependent hydrolase